ncbi:E3 ubiquitin-protein ligase RNF103-like [Saccostrea cucullata]|uniref:E3 ubiquitin-protein ligase RNF103-like n=1 Tax=Saccostrea cuccullata TaxID=36930 RepID=UPI002ED41BD3
MWFKLVLLLIYVAVLFVLARLLEAVSWVETGVLSHRLLDPMTLSVLKLKTLLEQRGVSYEGIVEKHELSELVDATGLVTEGEVTDAAMEESTTPTNFTGGSHFLEQVEDAKDSVWLVRILTKQWDFKPLSDASWSALINKVTKFGVRVGNFNCKTDYRFCHWKSWDSTRLILGLPQKFQSKSQVQLYTYTGNYKLSSISNWIKDTVNHKVLTIKDPLELNKNWISYKPSEDPEIRIIMVSRQKQVPLFYSALSVRFPGRIRFGVTSREVLIKSNAWKLLPERDHLAYFIITKEKVFKYGTRPSESISFKSMETYLKCLYPSLNDVFILTLFICNSLTIFEISLVQGSFIKRIVMLLFCAIKYNIIHILVWMGLLTLFQIPFLADFIPYGLKLIRLLGVTDTMALVRADFKFYSRHLIIVEVWLGMYLLALGVGFYKKSTEEDSNQDWNFARFRTLEHLFYPLHPRSLSHLDRNAFLEWNQQEIPSLWMAAHMSSDYIKRLPTWPYTKVDPNNVTPEQTNTSHHSNYTILEQDNTPADRHTKERDNVTHLDSSSNIQNLRSETLTQNYDRSLRPCLTPGDFLECSQCVVCLEDYEPGVLLCGLPCKHSFHQRCILTWLQRDNHYCPVCRWPSNKQMPIHVHSE